MKDSERRTENEEKRSGDLRREVDRWKRGKNENIGNATIRRQRSMSSRATAPPKTRRSDDDDDVDVGRGG